MSLQPATAQRLRAQLRRYDDQLPAAVRVRALRVLERTEERAPRVDVELDLGVTPSGEPEQRWLFTLDFTDDAEQLLDGSPSDEDLRTAGFLVVTNVTEWWHTKDSEPDTAALARRVS
ncbi:hypothetical protein [Streptomyces sp. cg35]|uniref:hypothetical protein n=1 Tax=Streptomyces sp. cg35 TaxID=3421650 RepID=UPI003D166B24